MQPPIELLAVLGRGIRQKDDQLWVPTRDLEMYGENFTPLAKQQPIDDVNPHCLIGGGELNVSAGRVLCATHRETLKTVACAYGGRAPYLTEVNAPSEGEVMSDCLIQLLPEVACPEIIVWPREHQAQSGKTNTLQELQNVFELAVERGHENIGIVTVFVHYARMLLMASRQLLNPRFVHLKIQCFASEDILLRDNPNRGTRNRIRKLHGSRAFTRTLFFEQRGINCLLVGTY